MMNTNNTGEENTGHENSGHRNSGEMNSGHRNSGEMNSGHWNSGHRNSGDWNSGDSNSGHWNSGHRNSGHRNSGHRNSGHWNSGHWNSGDWNSGHRNSGFFNTDEPCVRMFNQQTNYQAGDIVFPNWFFFKLTEWIPSKNMTKEEKQQNPEHETTGGYLKTYDYKEAWRKAFEGETDPDEIRKAEQLPNFDYEIFEEITGISKEDFDKKLGRTPNNKPDTIIVDGATYRRVDT